MKPIGLEEVRRVSVAAAARDALDCVSGQGTREFWVHFDADVLDDAIMPAVDYRLPGGLTLVEIEHVLSHALAHPGAVGMEITIFNPRLDTDGRALSAFLDMLTSAFPNK
jgi:arginase